MEYNINTSIKNEIDIKLLSTTEFRLFLHRYFYSNQDFINDLLDMITSTDIVFSTTDYSPQTRSITIKIKKSVVKKDKNFVPNSTFYYPLFNNIFEILFKKNLHSIYSIAKECGYIDINNLLNETYINSMIPGLYSITCISDNAIVLYL